MRIAVPLHIEVLRVLRDGGAVSRAELIDRLDAPRPRLLAELERLVGIGYVAEAGKAESRGGRRSTLVELNPDLRFAAVDLGATSLSVEVTDGRLEPVIAYKEQVNIRSGPRVILQRVGELLDKAKVENAYQRLDAIGIGVPGPVSFRDGVPVSPPIMPGWDRFPVREFLTREHGCPSVVDNDVNIMAIGERHGGVAHSVDDFLYVKIGTGIGCGIHLDGSVYRGTDGLRRRHRAHPGRPARPGVLLRQRRLPRVDVLRRRALAAGDGRGDVRLVARPRGTADGRARARTARPGS